MQPSLTITALSKGLEVDRKAVRRYVAAGCPTTSLDAARVWKAANVRPRAISTIKKAAAARQKPPPPNPYQDARTRQAIAEATEAQIRVLERQGKLAHVDVIRAEYAKRMSALREAALQIPARLQSVLAAESDEAKVNVILQDEIFLFLARIAEPES